MEEAEKLAKRRARKEEKWYRNRNSSCSVTVGDRSSSSTSAISIVSGPMSAMSAGKLMRGRKPAAGKKGKPAKQNSIMMGDDGVAGNATAAAKDDVAFYEVQREMEERARLYTHDN